MPVKALLFVQCMNFTTFVPGSHKRPIDQMCSCLDRYIQTKIFLISPKDIILIEFFACVVAINLWKNIWTAANANFDLNENCVFWYVKMSVQNIQLIRHARFCLAKSRLMTHTLFVPETWSSVFLYITCISCMPCGIFRKIVIAVLRYNLKIRISWLRHQ